MLRKILPHAAIILSGMYLVFFLIDRVNSAMAFINNEITKHLLLILCAISVVNAIYLIHDERRKVRQQQARAEEARRRQRERREAQARRSYTDYRRY